MSRAAILGAGVIGAGWAARFLLSGWDVAVFDPDPAAAERLDTVLARARRAFPGLSERAPPRPGRLTRAATIPEAVAGADWIQESVPERIELKRKTFQAAQAASAPGTPLASSTSGFMPSELQACATRPEEILVAHPFNPVYLLPLVELVPGPATPPATLARAEATLRGLGMAPLTLRREVPAHIADRLLEAVWREALWLVHDGIATTAEIDEAIRLGFGLRWAQMGLFETYRIAGGPAGMGHFIEQFGPALKWPWSKLTDVPEMTSELAGRIAAQSDAQSGHLELDELEALRDANLVAILNALRGTGGGSATGAGAHLAALDAARPAPGLGEDGPVRTLERAVPLDWLDYNGHMNEARYLEAFSRSVDRFMELLGCDAAYIAAGRSFFTAETHLRHLDEAGAGEVIAVDTQVIDATPRKMHLFGTMRAGSRTLATCEQVLVHVSLESRRAEPAAEPVAGRLARLAEAHARLPRPEGLGRHAGAPR